MRYLIARRDTTTFMDLTERLERALGHNYLVLSTVTPSGHGWSTPLYFGTTPQLEFVAISSVDSTHAANIRTNPHVAWSIVLTELPPEHADGLMFVGTARELRKDDASTQYYADALYDKRFPDPHERSSHPADPARFEATGRRIYAFIPTQAFRVDQTDPQRVSKVHVSLDLLRQILQRKE